jgi:hypothetical protein
MHQLEFFANFVVDNSNADRPRRRVSVIPYKSACPRNEVFTRCCRPRRVVAGHYVADAHATGTAAGSAHFKDDDLVRLLDEQDTLPGHANYTRGLAAFCAEEANGERLVGPCIAPRCLNAAVFEHMHVVHEGVRANFGGQIDHRYARVAK